MPARQMTPSPNSLGIFRVSLFACRKKLIDLYYWCFPKARSRPAPLRARPGICSFWVYSRQRARPLWPLLVSKVSSALTQVLLRKVHSDSRSAERSEREAPEGPPEAPRGTATARRRRGQGNRRGPGAARRSTRPHAHAHGHARARHAHARTRHAHARTHPARFLRSAARGRAAGPPRDVEQTWSCSLAECAFSFQ